MSKTFARIDGIEGAPMRDESILYVPATESYCLLNTSAAAIWEALATPSTEEDLTEMLCAQFSGTTMEGVRTDVRETLLRMTEMSLIQEVT